MVLRPSIIHFDLLTRVNHFLVWKGMLMLIYFLVFKSKKVCFCIETTIRDWLIFLWFLSTYLLSSKITLVSLACLQWFKSLGHLIFSADLFSYHKFVMWSRQSMGIKLHVMTYIIIYSAIILFVWKRSVYIVIIVSHYFIFSTIKHRLKRTYLKWCPFDFRIENRSDRFVVLTSIFIKALRSHMEILNL